MKEIEACIGIKDIGKMALFEKLTGALPIEPKLGWFKLSITDKDSEDLLYWKYLYNAMMCYAKFASRGDEDLFQLLIKDAKEKLKKIFPNI